MKVSRVGAPRKSSQASAQSEHRPFDCAQGSALGHPSERGIDHSADDVSAPKGRNNTAHGVGHGYAATIPDISPGGAKDIIFPRFSDAIASDEPNG